MITRSGRIRIEVAALTLLALSSVSIVAHAQQPGGPPPGGFGGPGGGRIQPATAPADALASELNLTATQVDKIKAIQAAYRKDRDSLMPPRDNQGGGPPNREAMQSIMEKLQALDKATSDKIVAVLTDDQKAALPRVIQMLDAFQSAGVPPQVIGDLKLTDDQKKQALRINKEMQQAMQQAMQDQDRQAMMDARKKAHDEILALLTDDQKAILDKFVKDHPRRGPGGPGGPGGRGPGGRGPGGPGGPPPGDGNGPPPPPDGNGPPPPDGSGPPPPPDGDGPPPPPDGNGPPPAH
jgi:hypothetical protein